MKPNRLSILALSVLGSANVFADVDYKIDLSQPQHHLAQVSVTFPEAKAGELTVNLPVWRTGKYQVLPLSDGVRLFTAKDSKGNPLLWKRSASGEWKIALDNPTNVTVSYQLYANELGQRVRHIDSSHAYLDASGVLMYSPQFREDPVAVQLTVRENWQSYSGMSSGKMAHSFIAPNYDVLIDSPIETGVSTHKKFSANGKDYELVFWGEGNYDADKVVKDLTALSGQAKAIWDDYPFDRYVYMVHATSGAGGATEHLNSTVIQLPRFSFRERKDYLRFISTASHEFIHTWNVKAYRPAGLVPYDYQHENMTELLWIAEGSTSYFQGQLLLRAGVMTPKEFLEDLAKRIEKSELTPGREIQSVAEASLGEWSSTGGDYAINHSVNIYSEGYLASLALDFSLLTDSNLAHSYRDVHRKLYQDYRVPKGYTVADVQQILKDLSGKDYGPWWQSHVNSPLSLEFSSLLSQAGLVMSYGKDAKAEPFTGMTLSSEYGSLVLAQVLRNSPAWQAGIMAGDEIIAINGLKVTAQGFDKRIKDFKVGDKVEITLFNNDKIKQVALTLGEKQSGKLVLKGDVKATKQQKAFFKAWLGIDWPFDNKGELLTKS
ncbi:PDZ domain-containing protein [Shewanella xiamenensis]|uniref:M61 family metallopeptidase n=1 Tax=Shewanella TaxID=22 RepID=UPI0002F1F85F|nr:MULTISPECIES: PDZ domain-containing protein [Shewanella]MCT8857871.1 PDZ domain-containing protein [Shewanella xiamenensis]PWH04804.1 M61 family peptidase [Shewanella xiamenensis]UWG65970.1 PDZ domain-containing protein [Shewanella xiamenensis]